MQHSRVGQGGMRKLPGNGCPGRLLIGLEVQSPEISIPGLAVCRITDRLKRNFHFRDPFIGVILQLELNLAVPFAVFGFTRPDSVGDSA